MEWLAKFVRTKTPLEDESNFMGAGCIFTNEAHVLAGFQPNKKTPSISGFGGKREATETHMQTALRETLEELFDMKPISPHLIELIEANLKPTRILKQKTKDGLYYIIHYTFEDLKQILNFASSYCIDTPLYEKWPTNVQRLIFYRKMGKASEVSQLCLLPFIEKITIDENFKKDLYGLKVYSE
jgi:hypothetical protein